MRRPLRRLPLWIALVLSGCASFVPEATDRKDRRAGPAVPVTWPGRYPEPLEEVAGQPLPVRDSESGLFNRRDDSRFTIGTRHEPASILHHYPTYIGRYGQGTMAHWKDKVWWSSEQSDQAFTRYHFATTALPAAEFQRAQRHWVGYLEDPTTQRPAISAIALEVYEPPAAKPRGVVLVSPRHNGDKPELPLRSELLSRGFVVVSSKMDAARRLYERLEVGELRHFECLGRQAAAQVDAALADISYGFEALLACLKEHRPDLPQEPLYVVGFGANSFPVLAIVQRLGSRVRGFVLVGSGADMLDCGMKSSQWEQPLGVSWPEDEPLAEDRHAVVAAYRRAAALDPYNLAPALRHVPALLLLAHADEEMPSENGEILYHMLGRPDLYHFPFGHAWLMRRLPDFTQPIADWIEARSCASTPATN